MCFTLKLCRSIGPNITIASFLLRILFLDSGTIVGAASASGRFARALPAFKVESGIRAYAQREENDSDEKSHVGTPEETESPRSDLGRAASVVETVAGFAECGTAQGELLAKWHFLNHYMR